MALALLDVCFGVVNAWFVQHDFSSHEFRAGLIRKLGNLGMVVMADVIDAMLLGGSSYSWRATYDSTNSKLTLYCYSSNARGLLTSGRTYTYTFIKWT